MLYGLYGSQLGIRHNTQFVPPGTRAPLPGLVERLRAAGYQTTGFGRTHWYAKPPEGFEPPSRTCQLHGFEYMATSLPSTDPGDIHYHTDVPESHATYLGERNEFGPGGESVKGYTGVVSELPAMDHADGWAVRKCMEWLQQGGRDERPWFCYLSFILPHAGFNNPPEFEALYDLDNIPDMPVPPWGEDQAPHCFTWSWVTEPWKNLSPAERGRTTLRYFAAVSFADHLFGKALDAMRAAGQLDNALILFTSDHGEMLGRRFHRFSKYSLYEGSVRVPCIVAGSRVPEARRGTVDHRPVELVDVLPTLTAAAGCAPDPHLPGLDMLGDRRRCGSFAEYHGSGYEDEQHGPAWMWREDGWKLILHLSGPVDELVSNLDHVRGELYDLGADPDEWHNLYDDPASRDRRQAMTHALLLYMMQAFARFPHAFSRIPLRGKPSDREPQA
jgi:arylsulfatase A-like enzyme